MFTRTAVHVTVHLLPAIALLRVHNKTTNPPCLYRFNIQVKNLKFGDGVEQANNEPARVQIQGV